MQDQIPLFVIPLSLLIVAIIAILLLAFTRKQGGSSLNVKKYQSRWLAIENSLERDNAASYTLAIFEADKLLDCALKERQFKGQTMGERMKAAQSSWGNANHIWSAHKIRNRLAHETDVALSRDVALRALSAYKQGLKDLGAF